MSVIAGRSLSLPRYVLTSVILCAIYVALVQAGLSFTPEGTDITPVWPPSGFATAALFIFGIRYWPAVLLGSLLGNSLFGYLSPPAIAMIICVDTLEAIMAAVLLRVFKVRPQLTRVRDVVALVCSTTFGSTMFAATCGTAVIYTDGQLTPEAVPNAWFVYWISNITANLTLAPLLLIWASSAGAMMRDLRQRKYALAEAAILIAVVFALGQSIWFSTREGLLELEYIMFPLLMWAGLRFGSGLTATVIALVSMTAIIGTSGGAGPFGERPVYSALFMMQMYISVYALSGLIVAGVAEERAAAKLQVSKSRDSLEIIVAERTKEIRQTGAMLQAVLDNVPSAVVACDAQGQLTTINRAARDIYGGSQDFSGSQVWAEDFKLYQTDGKTPLQESEVPLHGALNGETFRNLEFAVRPDSGDPRSLLISGQPILTNNSVQGAVVAAQDVTEQRHAQQLYHLFQLAAVTSNEAPDVEQAVLVILESVCLYIGWPIGHALHIENYQGRQIAESSDIWYARDTDKLEILRTITQGQRHTAGVGLPGHVLSTGEAIWIADVLEDSRFTRVDIVGSPPIVSAVAFPVTAGPEIVAILEFFNYSRVEPDLQLMESMKFVCTQLGRVYERSDATRRLMSMTLRDPLTGRPNRLAFIEVLRQAMAHSKRRTGYSFGVLFLDLDRFKIVNDSLGHAVGDALLVEAADRISSCLREGDSIYSIPGRSWPAQRRDERCQGGQAN
jgi:PAS domain S-box-containing protein